MTNALPHLLAIGLLWIAFLFVVFLLRRRARSLHSQGYSAYWDMTKVNKYFDTAFVLVNSVFFAIALFAVIFLTSPWSRDREEMTLVPPATVPEDFVAATPKQIVETNTTALTEKGDKRRRQATEDNTRAFEDARALFQSAKGEN